MNRKYFNTTSEEICTSDDVMKVICLDREGCSETGIYLANYGQSCGQFCSTKSNFIFFTLQLSYFFLTKSKSFSKAISDMACDLESYALERWKRATWPRNNTFFHHTSPFDWNFKSLLQPSTNILLKCNLW